MKYTFAILLLVIFFITKPTSILAQCPTQNLPSTTVKGKFDLNFKGKIYAVDGVNLIDKIQVCTNATFNLSDKSGLAGIQFYFQPARATFPNPPASYQPGNTRVFNTPMVAGQYILIQISYVSAQVRAYVCQPIEVVAPSVNPKFTLSSCVDKQVQMNIPTDPNNNFDSYTISWGDATPVEAVTKAQIPLIAKIHSYANNAPRNITVRGIKAGSLCDGLTQQTIAPNAAKVLPRLVNIAVQDNDTILIRYNGGYSAFDFYQKWGADNFRNVKNIVAPPAALNTLKIAVKDANKEQYCYKIGITDACPRTTYSDSTCSIPLQVSVLDRRNVLKWKTLSAARFVSYRIVKNANINFRNITNAATDTLTDRPTVCGTTYTYQVIAQSGTNVQSLSRSIAVIGVDSTKPPALTNVLVSVEKGKVSIAATLPAGQRLKSYTFYRWKNNKLESFNAGGNGNKVVDDKSNPTAQQECYKVSYYNVCSIMADTSAAFCPSYLSLESTGIKWTEYQKFFAGLGAYYVEKLDDKSTILKTDKADKNLKFDVDPLSIDPANPIVNYRIRAVSANNLTSYSNEVKYAQKLLLFLPGGFTPNGDNINDMFEVKAVFVKTFSMKIYDRFGSVIFQTNDYKIAWDGTQHDKPVPTGIYFYDIRAMDFKGELTKKSGEVMVLR